MTHWHAIWGLTCIGLALGLNHQMHPRAERHYEPEELTLQTGKLTLDTAGGTRDFGLINVKLASANIEVIDRVRVMREIRWRSPIVGDAPPALQIFASFVDLPGLSDGQFDIVQLKGADVPIVPMGFGDELPSYVDLGGDQPSLLVGGTFRLIEVLAFGEVNGKSSWRVTGTASLDIDTPRAIETIRGRFNAKMMWE